jgi:hypothetical protein
MLKVKLVHDYTKYNEKLEKGVEGVALETPEIQKERSLEDNFVKVKFDGITEVDVLWRGLEIIDEDYLSKKQAEKDAYYDSVKSATNIINTIGPKGGFKKLEFDNRENHIIIEEKEQGEEHIEYFNKFGLNIKVIQLEKKEPVKKNKK